MSHDTRRRFLLGAAGTSLALVGCAKLSGQPKGEQAEDVAPPEDLMREHGVLNRILLVYDESARRLETQQPLPFDALAKSADILRRFIEQYHEKLEEDFLFPRFEKANKLVDLVATLRRQHAAGRAVTDVVQRLTVGGGASKDADRKRLVETLRAFTRMYRPHEAREDTVLFPALRTIVSPKEFHELGEQFEDKEHELFGKEGFEGIVTQVAAIEQTLELYDLDQFTPVG